jgi:hypothetical protein
MSPTIPDARLSCVRESHEPLSQDRVQVVTVHEPAPGDSRVPEAFVQDLWETQRFDRQHLSTTTGRSVRIVDPGTPNTDAGPDFSNAHIQIDGLDWHGDVEIHVHSGGWFNHEHDEDPRYDRVVLHVTLHADLHTGHLSRSDGTRLPEIVLAPRIERSLRSLVRSFRQRDPDTLVCAPRWSEVPGNLTRSWIRQLGRERIQEKADRVRHRVDAGARVEDVLHEMLFTALGYAKNAEPMTRLARRLPLDRVRSLSEAFDREALHLGVAGLLPTPSELLSSDRATADAVMDLRARFDRLTAQRPVPQMNATEWTFFRLRPNNVPPLRIAQAVAWFGEDGLLRDATAGSSPAHSSPAHASPAHSSQARGPIDRLASDAASSDPIPALRRRLHARPTAFWNTHYRLTRTAKPHNPSLGQTRIDTLLVNVVVPVLIAQAASHQDAAAEENAWDVLRALPASRDSVVRIYKDLGTHPQSALEAQGMHALHRRLCTSGGCLQCSIGRYLLRDG